MLIITNAKAYVVSKEVERKIKLENITGMTYDGTKEIIAYVRDQYDFRFRVSNLDHHDNLIQSFTKLINAAKAEAKRNKPLRGQSEDRVMLTSQEGFP
jgi:hypothetical protein